MRQCACGKKLNVNSKDVCYTCREKEYQTEYRKKNKEKMKEYLKQYYKDHKSEIRDATKRYSLSDPERTRRYKRKHKKLLEYKLRERIRKRIRHAIGKNSRPSSSVKELGCTVGELKSYLESKFQPGMTWENWGFYGWHVDHIRPLSSFDLTNLEQFKKACHYTNLQPLWAKENLHKSSKYIELQVKL